MVDVRGEEKGREGKKEERRGLETREGKGW